MKVEGKIEKPCITTEEKDCALAFKVELTPAEEGSVGVKVTWLRGLEDKLFESFCGMLKRQLTEE